MVPDAQSKKSILDVPDPHFRVSKPFEVGHETLAYQSRHELREEEDVDKVLDMGTNIEENIDAPKTIERLEQISEINNQRRKEEEDDDEDNLEIFDDNNISLDISDVHDLSKELRVEAPPLLDDIEVLD